MEGKSKVAYLAAVRQAQEHRAAIDRDPQYQALRLRGLAGLIRASEQGLDEIANLHETAFFIASTLEEVAEALAPQPS